GEEQRLVEVPAQHRAGRERAGNLDIREVAEPLPRAREDALARQPMHGGVEIELARQRSRHGDVGVDRERRRRRCHRRAQSFAKRPIRTAVPPGWRLRVPGMTSTASSYGVSQTWSPSCAIGVPARAITERPTTGTRK